MTGELNSESLSFTDMNQLLYVKTRTDINDICAM
jgi:hypothetical protein